jgi:hypothetical protein
MRRFRPSFTEVISPFRTRFRQTAADSPVVAESSRTLKNLASVISSRYTLRYYMSRRYICLICHPMIFAVPLSGAAQVP